MPRDLPTKGRFPVKAWTGGEKLEENVLLQLQNVSQLPFIHHHVAAMPDVHVGIGAAVGTVIPTVGAIVPAAVGVDIGCGMMAVKLPLQAQELDRPGMLTQLRALIERDIPVGNGQHGEHRSQDVPDHALKLIRHLGAFKAQLGKDETKKLAAQLGTLGGGNHFIELCRDGNGGLWVLLHSGSRNIGNRLAKFHIQEARLLMKKAMISLPDPDLAYLTEKTSEFKDYIHDLLWAQKYAKLNRQEMMRKILSLLIRHLRINTNPDALLLEGLKLGTVIDCHHNYTQVEHHYGKDVYVTRKGALRAGVGELGIIPGSMGAKSFIVVGKGNAESFCSCSHGAGRRMGRQEAKRRFTEKDLREQTLGIECRKDIKIVDEIPAAYKDIDEVMENQKDLVEVKLELKQLICVKGS